MAQAERRGPQVLNIGEVLAQLSDDFPTMTASKIRFLEEKGLINPQRTPAGYRQYSESDVERLRFVLALQRDQYLPLTVSPRIVSAELASELNNRVRMLSEEQLRVESGASVPLLESLLSFGLIGHVNGNFDEHALQVARACVQLESHGLEPRHLRPFQAAADREFGLVERAVGTLMSRKDAASQARAAEAAREISELCLSLHRALVQDRISRMDS
jgi:DNA-binding transcriptional MerR regulator